MSIGGILAGALAGAGSAVQYNAQENIKQKREKALRQLDAKNRAALQASQNAQSASNTMNRIGSQERMNQARIDAQMEQALIDGSEVRLADDGTLVSFTPDGEGGVKVSPIDTRGMTFSDKDKDLGAVVDVYQSLSKRLSDPTLPEDERASIKSQVDILGPYILSGGATSFPDPSEVDRDVNEGMDALGGNGDQGDTGGSVKPPPNPNRSTSNSNDYIPNGLNGPIPEPRATEASGILDSAIAENAQRQAAEAEQQDRLRLSEEQAAERNAINEYNAALRSEVIGPLNKAQYLINKYQTAMPGTGNAGIPNDQVQQLGDEIYSVLQNSLNRDKYNAITDSAKNSVRTVFEELLALGYQPPQGNQ